MSDQVEEQEMPKHEGFNEVVAGQEHVDDPGESFAIEDPLAQARGFIITVQDKPDGSDETRLGLAQALALVSIGESLEKLVAAKGID